MSDTAAQKAKEAGVDDSSDSAQHQHVVVDMNDYLEHHTSDSPIASFAIEKHQRNTEDNPHRENTNTLPVLVRRVNSEELLPSPLKTTSQLLCLAYLSMLCCCVCASKAVDYAFKAKQKRNAGVLSSAMDEANKACRCMKFALICGSVGWLIGIIFLALFLSGVPI